MSNFPCRKIKPTPSTETEIEIETEIGTFSETDFGRNFVIYS